MAALNTRGAQGSGLVRPLFPRERARAVGVDSIEGLLELRELRAAEELDQLTAAGGTVG